MFQKGFSEHQSLRTTAGPPPCVNIYMAYSERNK